MKTRNALGFALAVAVTAAAAPQAVAQAASTASANPTILDALAKLQAAVSALDGKITAIGTAAIDLQNSADTNVRYSPPVFIAQTGAIVCSIANVTDSARALKMEVIAGDDGTVKTTFFSDFTLKAREGTVASAQLSRGVFYCRYTVLDGTRSDIRGLAAVFDATGSMPTIQTPAE